MPALETYVDMPTELGRTAALDSVEHGAFAEGQRMRGLVVLAVPSYDIRQLEPRPVPLRHPGRVSAGLVIAHLGLLLSGSLPSRRLRAGGLTRFPQPVGGALGLPDQLGADLSVTRSRLDRCVPEQHLQRPNVSARFQKVPLRPLRRLARRPPLRPR